MQLVLSDAVESLTDDDPNEAYEVVPFDRTTPRLERLRLAGTPDRQTLGGPTNA